MSGLQGSSPRYRYRIFSFIEDVELKHCNNQSHKISLSICKFLVKRSTSTSDIVIMWLLIDSCIRKFCNRSMKVWIEEITIAFHLQGRRSIIGIEKLKLLKQIHCRKNDRNLENQSITASRHRMISKVPRFYFEVTAPDLIWNLWFPWTVVASKRLVNYPAKIKFHWKSIETKWEISKEVHALLFR